MAEIEDIVELLKLLALLIMVWIFWFTTDWLALKIHAIYAIWIDKKPTSSKIRIKKSAASLTQTHNRCYKKDVGHPSIREDLKKARDGNVSSVSISSMTSNTSSDVVWSTTTSADETLSLLEDTSLSEADTSVTSSSTSSVGFPSDRETQNPCKEGQEHNFFEAVSNKSDAKYPVSDELELCMSATISKLSAKVGSNRLAAVDRFSPQIKSLTATGNTTKLVKTMIPKRSSHTEERLVFPKPHAHKVHCPRVPCSTVDMGTRQHLEFHINKKQVQKLCGEDTNFTETPAELAGYGRGRQDASFNQETSSVRPDSAEAKLEASPLVNQMRQEVSQQVSEGFLHAKILQSAKTKMEAASQESKQHTLREELLQPRCIPTLLSSKTARVSHDQQMGRAEENCLAGEGRRDSSSSALSCSSNENQRSRSRSRKNPSAPRDHLPVHHDGHKRQSTQDNGHQGNFSHAITFQSLLTLSRSIHVECSPQPNNPIPITMEKTDQVQKLWGEAQCTSPKSEQKTLREELPQPRGPPTLLSLELARVSQGKRMGRSEEKILAGEGQHDSSLAALSCSSEETLGSSGGTCTPRNYLSLCHDCHKTERTPQVWSWEALSHASSSQSLHTLSSSSPVNLSPQSKSPTGVERADHFLEENILKGDSCQENTLLLPKPSAHHGPRVPYPGLGAKTRKHLEFHIDQKLQKLWDLPTASNHSHAELTGYGRGQQDAFSVKCGSVVTKSESTLLPQEVRQNASQQLSNGFFHPKPSQSSLSKIEGTSPESEPQVLIEELPYWKTGGSQTSLASREEENKLSGGTSGERFLSGQSSSSDAYLRISARSREAPYTTKEYLWGIHQDKRQDSLSHATGDSTKSSTEARVAKLEDDSVCENSYQEKDILENWAQLRVTTTVTCQENNVDTLSQQSVVIENSSVAMPTPTTIPLLPQSPAVLEPGEKEPQGAKPLLPSKKKRRPRPKKSLKSSSKSLKEVLPQPKSLTSCETKHAAQDSQRGRDEDGSMFNQDKKMPHSFVPSFQGEPALQDGKRGEAIAAFPPTCPIPPPLNHPKTFSRHQLRNSILTSLQVKWVAKDLQMSVMQSLELVDGVLRAEYPICDVCGTCSPSCPHPRSKNGSFIQVYPQLRVQNGKFHLYMNFGVKMKSTVAKSWGLLEAAGQNALKGGSTPERSSSSTSSSRKASIPVEQPSGDLVKLLQSTAQRDQVKIMLQAQRGISMKLTAQGRSCSLATAPQQLHQAPATRAEQPKTKRQPSCYDFPRALAWQKLRHSRLTSASMERLVQGIHPNTSHTSERKRQELKSECLVCSVCGSCRPSCPHPYSKGDGTLCIYPQLTVRGGHLRVDLDYYLKIKRSHGKKWGLKETVGAETAKDHKHHHKQDRGDDRKTRFPGVGDPGPSHQTKTKLQVSSFLTSRSFGKRKATGAKQGVAGTEPSLLGDRQKKDAGTAKVSRNFMKKIMNVIKNVWAKLQKKHAKRFAKKLGGK